MYRSESKIKYGNSGIGKTWELKVKQKYILYIQSTCLSNEIELLEFIFFDPF